MAKRTGKETARASESAQEEKAHGDIDVDPKSVHRRKRRNIVLEGKKIY